MVGDEQRKPSCQAQVGGGGVWGKLSRGTDAARPGTVRVAWGAKSGVEEALTGKMDSRKITMDDDGLRRTTTRGKQIWT